MDYLIQKLYALFFWRMPIGEILSNMYDIYLHLKYSFKINRSGDKDNLKHYIIKEYHIIEKGLALPEPRPGFGQSKVNHLIDKSEIYLEKYGQSQLISSISDCLKGYLSFNDRVNAILPAYLKYKIENFILKVDVSYSGGVRSVTKDEIHAFSSMDFEGFIRSRYSVRDFSKQSIDNDIIYSAVELAKYAPSACNRQGWNVHVYSDKNIMKELLEIQGGTGGFTGCINKLIIVTGNVKAFTKYESNQIFVDGGIFSMNLIFALHHKGLGSCPLSTGFSYVIEKKIKQIAGMAENERLVVMLAVGHLKDEFRVAVSERKETSEIIVIH